MKEREIKKQCKQNRKNVRTTFPIVVKNQALTLTVSFLSIFHQCDILLLFVFLRYTNILVFMNTAIKFVALSYQ